MTFSGIKRLSKIVLQHPDYLFLIVLGSILAVHGIRLELGPDTMGIPPERVGPGTYMSAIGFLLILCSVISLVKRVGTHLISEGPVMSGATVKSFVLIGVCVVIMPFAGFSLSVGLFLIAYLMWLHRQRFLASLIFSAGLVAAYFFLFVKVAKVVLPRGFVGF